MTRIPIARLTRVRRRLAHRPQDIHFHLGADGRPFACEAARCGSPGLNLDEAAAESARRGG